MRLGFLRKTFGVLLIGAGFSACGGAGGTVGQEADVLSRDFLVRPQRAVIAETNNGAQWDPDGSPPDVTVTVTCPGNDDEVTEPLEAFNPVWNNANGCSDEGRQLVNTGFQFFVDDSDPGFSDRISENVIEVPITEADLRRGSITIETDGNLRSITFDLFAL